MKIRVKTNNINVYCVPPVMLKIYYRCSRPISSIMREVTSETRTRRRVENIPNLHLR